MKKSRHPQIRFFIGKVNGHFNYDGWSNKHNIFFCKKTSAVAKANLILGQKGQVYIKVTYGKKFYNDGIFDTQREFLKALASFTEKPLLDYVLEEK